MDEPKNPKDIIGSTKVPFHLWPATATVEGAMALMTGAVKYGRMNWRGIEVRASIYIDALLRHTYKYLEGEDADEDSGLPHTAHALACLAILVDAKAAGTLVDDRNYPGGFLKALEALTPKVSAIKATMRPDIRHLDLQEWEREEEAAYYNEHAPRTGDML